MPVYKSISIIICFYNAQDRLKETLEHIKQLKINNYSVELILINNNSTDQSELIIRNTLESFSGFPWLIIKEPTPGLTPARIKGIASARSEVVLFCDDDNWLNEDYIIVGMNRLNSERNIGILGGLGEPVSVVNFPSWFEENQNFYAVGPQFDAAGIVRGKRNVVYGAGMFMVKDYFNKIVSVGFKPISSDRIGNQLSSGGDSELCLAFQLAGYIIYYDDNLKFKHYIEKKRLTNDYLIRLKKGMSESRFVTRFYLDYLNGVYPKISRSFWIKELIYTLKNLFVELCLFDTSDIQRKLKFIRFLLKQQGKYSKAVTHILWTCNQLAQLKEHDA